MAESIVEFVVTDHAERAMLQRGIRFSVVRAVLIAPEQRLRVRPGREVLQSRIALPDGLYLVRVFVDVDTDPPAVVTVYRTSRIDTYWNGRS